MKIKISILLLFFVLFDFSKVYACTKFVYTGENGIVLSARSTDWADKVSTNLWILPRGIIRNGLAGENSVRWISKYGSVVATVHNIMSIDGINEKGLTMGILRLKESKFIAKNKARNKKALGIALWGQYFLDNFATVDEAVKEMERGNIYVVPFDLPKNESSGMHLAISDSKGDFAVFEYTDGKLNIYHDKKYKIATNSPKYSDQMAVSNYWEDVDGKFLPGTRNSYDRFSRGFFYLNKMPKTNNLELAMSYTLSLIRNLSSPLGIKNNGNQEDSATLWRTVCDSSNMTYYYESAFKTYGFTIDLKRINFNADQKVKMINLLKGDYYFSDATDKFVEAEAFKFLSSDRLVDVRQFE